MKAKEIRELATEEIRERIRETEAELQRLRFQHAIAELENPMQLRNLRRELARLKTILRERELAEQA